jgi:TRAP-type C4-dicarboxylate transport system substrate-binding protein
VIKRTVVKAVAAGLLTAVLGHGEAQEVKTLKFAQPFAASHWHYVESGKRFQDAVTKATNGKVQWQSYHAGQLGKDYIAMLSSGTVDVVLTPTSYEAAKLPLSSVTELPGLFSSGCEASNKFWNVAKEGAPLNVAEYKPQNIKVLYVYAHSPYSILTTKKRITTWNDVEGLKIRAVGSAMDKTVRALGAVPVRVAGTEFYDAFTRGTVDGGVLPIGAARGVGIDKVIHHAVANAPINSGSIVVGMRQTVWDSLTPDFQAAMTQAAAETQQYICEWVDRADVEEEKRLVNEEKLDVTRLSKEERARWSERLQSVSAEWAKELDAMGKPGTAVLQAFKDAPGK